MVHKAEIIFIAIVILIFSGFYFSMTSPRFSLMDFSETTFCNENGYKYVIGGYLEYKDSDYGMVGCAKRFVEGWEKEYFNVTKDWRGNLHKMKDALVSGDEQ